MIKRREKYEKEGYWLNETYGTLIRKLAYKYENKIAIVDDEVQFTYEELNEYSDNLAMFLQGQGILLGDRVIVQLANNIYLPVVYFALFKIGAIMIPAFPGLREKEIQSIANEAAVKAYFCAEEYMGFTYNEMAKNIFDNTPSLEILLFQSDLQSSSLLKSKREVVFKEVSYLDTALILLSGGSTGIPKLIERSYADHFYTVRRMAEICRINEDSVYLAAMPLSHNFFICGPGFLGTLYAGGKVIISTTPSPDEIFSLIDNEKVTITSLVPAIAKVCIEMYSFYEECDFTSLSVVQLGGAVVESELVENIEEKFQCKVQQIYGMSEGIICCTRLEDELDVVLHTQGKPIASADEIKIIDSEERTLAEGKTGELVAKGPYTVTEYYNKKYKNKFTKDGFYKTGDKARIRKDGNVEILGRIDEQINKGGEKIMPIEIENILNKFSEVEDVVVVGKKDKIMGDQIWAFVIPADKKPVSDEIKDKMLEQNIAIYKIPDHIIVLEEWPLTPVGKIDKQKLMNTQIDNQ